VNQPPSEYCVRKTNYSEEDGDIETAVYWEIVEPDGHVCNCVIFWLTESREEVIQSLQDLKEKAIAFSVPEEGLVELDEAIQDELDSSI
jgi:hypothetical protein